MLKINPKDAFNGLFTNIVQKLPSQIPKSSKAFETYFNIIKKCFGMLCEPLIYLFQQSPKNGVFPDDLKIPKVTPIYKPGDSSDISNCRPISILPCFSKILERLIYNRLYKYLKENNILL